VIRRLKQALARWFPLGPKLICGGQQCMDLAGIADLWRDLTPWPGVIVFDVPADPPHGLVAADGFVGAWPGRLNQAIPRRAAAAPPWLWSSLSDGNDPTVRKAWFESLCCVPSLIAPVPAERGLPCPGDCRSRCCSVDRCYGCGRLSAGWPPWAD